MAQQRKVLAKLTPETLQSGADIDDAVLARLGVFLDVPRINLFTDGPLPGPAELQVAIARALDSLGPVKRGRSAATSSLATRQFGLGLAHIWKQQTGQSPHRSVTGTDTYSAANFRARGAFRGGGYEERGAFHRFVNAVAGFAPPELRKPRKGAKCRPSIIWLARRFRR